MSAYPPALYDQNRAGVQSSAAAIVPVLADLFAPSSVLDVGCGEGWWMGEFDALGADVFGVDGPHVSTAPGTFVAQDLESPLPAGEWDLALCLEVAEHLSPRRAETLVAELAERAPTVVFSAAIPGQGGSGHVNEQWPGYWAALFAAHGYRGSGALRWRFWTDTRVKDWYRQNLLVFGDLGGLPEDGCPGVVHPDSWDWHRR